MRRGLRGAWHLAAPIPRLAREAALRGKQVAVLDPAAYGGYKDTSAAWAAGALAVDPRPTAAAAGGETPAVPAELCEAWAERVAMMMADGGMPPTDAERLAWEGLGDTAAPR